MKNIEYFAPNGLEQAFALFRRYGKRAQWRTGGTELVNEKSSSKTRPQAVVDMKRLSALDYMETTATGLRIGALFRLREMEGSDLLRHNGFSALGHAAAALVPARVRNKATVVGALCGAPPSGELIPVLAVLGAWARIVGNGVDRMACVEEIAVGPEITILRPGELVVELVVPYLGRYAGCGYSKLSPRRSLELPVVNVAAMVRTDAQMARCHDARIVLATATATATRAQRAEAMLIDSWLGLSVIEQAAQVASEECRPVGDAEGAAWYEKKMVEVAVKRAVGLALAQIRSTANVGHV
jgi:carbon-monoxide dehydrogenase medium subunit